MKAMGWAGLCRILFLMGCSPALPQGQFGPYYRQSKHLVLATAETLVVYRVKYWTFQDGSLPALQLEYEAPFLVSDTAAVRREAFRLWPAFAPYAEAKGLKAAIITATNFHVSGVWPIAWTSHQDHFGLLVFKHLSGQWRLQHDSVPLPPMDKSGQPRIIEANGKPFPLDSSLPDVDKQ